MAGVFPIPVVGLTGGIASGKSTVACLLAARGVPVVDADALSREVVRPGAPALAAIARAFGPDVLAPDGSLDRARMAAIVFIDPERRRALERILHPVIHEAAVARVAAAAAAGHRWAVYEAALLVETGFHAVLEGLVVVAAATETQIARVMARDGFSREEVERRLAAQLPLADKCAVADHVVRNDGSLADTERQVDALCEALRARFGR